MDCSTYYPVMRGSEKTTHNYKQHRKYFVFVRSSPFVKISRRAACTQRGALVLTADIGDGRVLRTR